MKLAAFIESNKEDIADEWVEFARKNIDASKDLPLVEVRDHIVEMLGRIVTDLDSSQTKPQQQTKSHGNKEMAKEEEGAAIAHGAQRVDVGFDIVELSSEFRALRASVLRLWEKEAGDELTPEDVQDIIRFNEAVDEAWMISLERFHKKVDESKNWFLGILGHDLRNPLAAISGVQEILKLSNNLSEKEKAILKRSDSSVKRMAELITNLLELTNLRLGSGLSINKSTADLTKLTEQIVQEFELTYPDAEFQIKTPGPILGEWDILRLNQTITNLVANALRHGKPGGPVKIKISAEGNTATLEVHNEGNAIPESIRDMIFTGMYSSKNGNHANENSYGLGLYIVKEIVDGHGGEIDVQSTEAEGTTFTIALPRHQKEGE